MEILRHYGIEAVIDVRRWPISRRFAHFNRESLSIELERFGISYFHIESLGGYRKEGYEEYIKSDEFRRGIEGLIEIAAGRISCIICAERFPWRCHRRFISMALRDRGFEVRHIIERDRVWIPRSQYREGWSW